MQAACKAFMKTIQIAPGDNVAVALCPIPAGELVQAGTQASVKVPEDIPQGHKVALKHIAKEDNIIKIRICNRTCNGRDSGRKLGTYP